MEENIFLGIISLFVTMTAIFLSMFLMYGTQEEENNMKLTKETEYKDTLYIKELFKFGIMEINIEYLGYDIIAEGTEYEKRRNHYNLIYLGCSSEKFSCFADISFEEMLQKIIENITAKRKQKKAAERRNQQIYFYNKKGEK